MTDTPDAIRAAVEQRFALVARQPNAEKRFPVGRHEAKPGTWVHMPTGLRHTIQARTAVVILLTFLK